MPLYESVFIARQDISSAQAETLAEDMAKIITDNGGNVTKREFWGLRNLSFRINKNRKGHYVLLNIDAPAPAVHEMERVMRFNEDILRTLTVRVEELEEGQSAVLLQRNERPERGRGGPRGPGGPGGDRPRFGDPDRGDRPRFGDRDRPAAGGDRPPRTEGAE
jgi:small subunit ribosomal protein S6